MKNERENTYLVLVEFLSLVQCLEDLCVRVKINKPSFEPFLCLDHARRNQSICMQEKFVGSSEINNCFERPVTEP